MKSLRKSALVTALSALALAAGPAGCGKSKPPPPTTAPPATTAAPPTTAAAEDAAAAGNADTAKPAEVAAAGPKLIPTTSTSKEAVAEFEAGEALLFDARESDALARMKKALELDPDFLLALAFTGYMTPGKEGLASLEKAAAEAKSLPEAEHLRIDALLADRRGDEAKAAELEKKIAELAPDDWRAHGDLGNRAARASDVKGAIAAYARAAELNPKVGAVHNWLGYAYLRNGQKEEAIAAFKKYAELTPNEPNPHDSLAEALLGAGKLDEAEASFRKAAEVAPSFGYAWQGVAACRALGGDWKGAKEAIAKGIAASAHLPDRHELERDAAWIMAASGDVKGAVAALAALEKKAESDKLAPAALISAAFRAILLVEDKKLDEADKALTDAWAAADKTGDTSGGLIGARRFALALRASIAATRGKPDDAKARLAELGEMVKQVPGNANAQSLAKAAQGAVLMATDAKAAVAELAACRDDDSYCKWNEVRAREAAGDKEGAAAAKDKLSATPLRFLFYSYVRAKLGTIPKAGK